eukprot:1769811-Pleurochrysis_carterae.AAC.1
MPYTTHARHARGGWRRRQCYHSVRNMTTSRSFPMRRGAERTRRGKGDRKKVRRGWENKERQCVSWDRLRCGMSGITSVGVKQACHEESKRAT